MHRHTLTILRREVQPVPFTVYADFLARWQHLHPATRLAGRGALIQALQQLRATPVVGLVWERDVLPLRLARYDPAELAALCQGGELVWVGSGGADPRRGRVRFLFRGEGSAYLEPAPDDLSALGAAAQAVYSFLKSEGAVFFADIRANLDLDDAAAEAALIELAMAGLATNDSLDAMRQMVKSTQPQGRAPFSTLEGQLAERMAGRALSTRRPSRSQLQVAKRRVRERLEPESTSRGVGRWTLVHRQGVLGKPMSPEVRSDQQARQLLARHGVVTHASLAGEAGGWEWSSIYQQLQRLEMRGEVRRGYFVQSLPGIQFALPEVVERLRAARDGDQGAEEALVVMSACDPANLWGPPLEGGVAFSRIPSTWLVVQRGLPVLVAEDTGATLTTTQGADEGVVRRALQDLLGHLAGFERRVTVERWNGEPVLDSVGRMLLEAAGFYRDYPGMTWERH
jgi:ATP-dependent Lhr-like helicase